MTYLERSFGQANFMVVEMTLKNDCFTSSVNMALSVCNWELNPHAVGIWISIEANIQTAICGNHILITKLMVI